MFDSDAGDEKSPDPTSAEPQEGTPLLSNKLAEEDQIRLRLVRLLIKLGVFTFVKRGDVRKFCMMW